MSNNRGRHRFDEPETYEPPSDVQVALARAVESVDGRFDPEEWTFEESTFLVVTATRVTPVEDAAHNRLIFSSDCRTRWVGPEDDVEKALGELTREGALSRTELEWLLLDVMRYGKGEWHIEPIEDLGWLCSRRARFGGRKVVAVARNRTYVLLTETTREAARKAIVTLLDQPDSSEGGESDEDAAR